MFGEASYDANARRRGAIKGLLKSSSRRWHALQIFIVLLDFNVIASIYATRGTEEFSSWKAYFHDEISEYAFDDSLFDLLCLSLLRTIIVIACLSQSFHIRARKFFLKDFQQQYGTDADVPGDGGAAPYAINEEPSGLAESTKVPHSYANVAKELTALSRKRNAVYWIWGFSTVASFAVGVAKIFFVEWQWDPHPAYGDAIIILSCVWPALEVTILTWTLHYRYVLQRFVLSRYGKEEVERHYGFKFYDDDASRRLLDADIEAGLHAIDETESKPTLSRLAELAAPERGMLGVAFIALLIASGSTLAMPHIFGSVITAVLNKDVHKLNWNVVLMLIIVTIGALAALVRGWLFTLAGERFAARLRCRIFRAVTNQEVAFFDENRSGELSSRLSSDTAVIQSAVTVNMSMLLRYTVQIIGAIALIFNLSWKLTLVMLSVVPIVALAAVIYGKRMKLLRKKFQDALAKSNATAEESFSSIRTVRAFSNEKGAQAKYEKDVEESYSIGRLTAAAYGGFQGMVGIISQSAIALVLWYGGKQVLHGNMETGTLLSFLLYTMTVAFAFAFLSSLFGEFMQAVGAASRIFEILDRIPAIPVSGGSSLEEVNGHVSLKNIYFRYPSRVDEIVLKGINLELKPGTVTALVGRSGGGKSTVVALIERFYDPMPLDDVPASIALPSDGVKSVFGVSLDGVDIKTLNPVWYRRQIGYVSQEPTLFASTILENIRYGCATATVDEVVAAAKLANVHEFVTKFDSGYDTLVGERGVRLSGGQKQRIAIARAMILNPRILLLDEATSALDAESEYLVQEALTRLQENRTVLVIAHRLSTVKNADNVVVIDGGQVAERGSHDELLEKGGIYRDLVKRQLLQGGGETSEPVDSEGLSASQ